MTEMRHGWTITRHDDDASSRVVIEHPDHDDVTIPYRLDTADEHVLALIDARIEEQMADHPIDVCVTYENEPTQEYDVS